MSMGVEYSVDPSRTSGGRYHRVTTSLENVFVGTDFARASPKSANLEKKTIRTVIKVVKLKNCYFSEIEKYFYLYNIILIETNIIKVDKTPVSLKLTFLFIKLLYYHYYCIVSFPL